MKFIAPIVVFILFLSGCGFQQVEHTNRTQLITMNASQEMQLGLEASEQIKQENKEHLDIDKVFLNKVQTIGKNIARVANRPEFQWEFHTISKDVLNAFCLPGGKVFVYTGIKKAAHNDDQLATVISHEIAHALAQHGAERVSMNQIVGLGGQILSVAVQAKVPQYQNAFSTAYGYGAQLGLMLPYSRTHELEADKIGLILMKKAGYDLNEALNFWKNMGQESGSDEKTNDFFSTHPSNHKRIEQIKAYILELEANK
jgi:predicted Zn-dependent protease